MVLAEISYWRGWEPEPGPKSAANPRKPGAGFSRLCQVLLLFERPNLPCSQTYGDSLLRENVLGWLLAA